MGVTADRVRSTVRRLAVRRTHVLLVEVPGGFVARVRAEQACARRGWPVVAAPADADALVVCGAPGGPGSVRDAIDAVWAQLPGPRGRAEVTDPAEVETVLDALRDDLLRWRAVDDPVAPVDQDDDPDDTSHDDMDGMDMGGPAGIPLAEGADDRDGLEMDETHLRLGPVLSGWPAGLAVWCTLHGDLVTEVEVEAVPAADETAAHPGARRSDALAGALDLAGAQRLAQRSRTRRDHLLATTRPPADDLRRRLARSRVLAWSVRGLGVVSAAQAAEHGWPAAWVGDAYDRLLRLAGPAPTGPLVTTGQVAGAFPDLMVGLELGAARLVAAGLVGQAAAPLPAPEARRDVVPA